MRNAGRRASAQPSANSSNTISAANLLSAAGAHKQKHSFSGVSGSKGKSSDRLLNVGKSLFLENTE